MTIAFRAATTAVPSGVNSFVIAKPASVADGDFLRFDYQSSSNAITITGGLTGFTLFPSSPTVVNTGRNYYSYYKFASGEPASWTVTLSGFGIGAASMVSYSGNNLAVDQIGVGSIGTASSANMVVPSFTTTQAGMLIPGVGFDSGSTPGSSTPPAGFTERADISPASNFAVTVAELAQGAAGATGTMTFVANTALVSNGDAAYAFVNIYEPAVAANPGLDDSADCAAMIAEF